MEIKFATQLKWLNYQQQRPTQLNFSKIFAMAYPRHGPNSASRSSMNLPTELTFPEDPSLGYVYNDKQEIHRPPGIKTMEEWGNQILPDGKHAGKRFKEAAQQDPGYVNYMVTATRLTSPWAKSFQNYARALNPEELMKKGSGSTKKKAPPKSKPMYAIPDYKTDSGEGSDFALIPEKPTLKRGMGSTEEETKMDVKDIEKANQLKGQIAALQRELDQVSEQ